MCYITHLKVSYYTDVFLQHINGCVKIISKSFEVRQYINIFVQIKGPTVYIRLASLKSNNIYIYDITVLFIYGNHFWKFKFQTLDKNNWLPIELSLHTIELISGLDVRKQILNRNKYWWVHRFNIDCSSSSTLSLISHRQALPGRVK